MTSELREAAAYAAGRLRYGADRDVSHPIYQHLVNASLGDPHSAPVLDAIRYIIEWERRPPVVDG